MVRREVWRRGLATLLVLVGSLFIGPQARPTVAREEVCFAATPVCVQGRFLEYWRANGGLDVFGRPLTAEQPEKLIDHQVHTVQYFERARFELHPQNAPPDDVLLGQLGRLYRVPDPPVAPRPDARYFPATGHTLGGDFRTHWETHGGLRVFGYPLSEELQEPTGATTSLTVQYFERARLEYHPENAGRPYVVLGTRLADWLLIETEDRGGRGVPRRPGFFAPDEPAFTEQDMRQFLEAYWDAHPMPSPGRGTPAASHPGDIFLPAGTIESVEFLTNHELRQRLGRWDRPFDERLMCLVTLRTTAQPGRPTYLDFDAHLGAVRARIGG